MSLEFNFVADKITKGRIYPALARHEARPYTQGWREFGQHYPYTTPLRLQEYCDAHGVKINCYSIEDQLPVNSTYYPICLGFFDFDIDYFELLPSRVRERLDNLDLKILFYYHEGDNPQHIKSRLDWLVTDHDLPGDCYVFVSSNTQADRLPNFVTFQDFELWYYQRNTKPALAVYNHVRSHEFTALVRLHKWWRATVMADLWRNGLLDNSFWSYCETPDPDQIPNDNPIEIDAISRLRWDLDKFLASAPYYADNLDQAQRNDHSVNIDKFYTDAYCNIVLESQFDVDQSGGAFITEKTFKPIKHGQLFFIAGGAGSLQVLRDLGYRTFDNVLDNTYDLEPSHTMRWQKLLESIEKARSQGLHNLFEQCRDDIEYNQQLFVSSKQDRLNNLHRKIHEKS